MSSTILLLYRSPLTRQAWVGALAAFIVTFTLTGSAQAQGRLPFVGTRTFCSGDNLGVIAVVTIGNDGMTTIQSNILPENRERSLTHSGLLNNKRILKWTGKYFLKIESGASLVLYDGQYSVDRAIPCSEVFPAVPAESEVVHRILTTPPGGNDQVPVGRMAPDVLIANLYVQGNQVFQVQSRALLDRYFEKSLADSIWKQFVDAENADYEDDDAPGVLFPASSDQRIRKFVIAKPVYGKRKAEVDIIYEDFGNKATITYSLVGSDEEWKISDVKYSKEPGDTLVEIYRKAYEAGPDEPTPAAAPAGASNGTGEVLAVKPPPSRARVAAQPGPTSNTSRSTNREDKLVEVLKLLMPISDNWRAVGSLKIVTWLPENALADCLPDGGGFMQTGRLKTPDQPMTITVTGPRSMPFNFYLHPDGIDVDENKLLDSLVRAGLGPKLASSPIDPTDPPDDTKWWSVRIGGAAGFVSFSYACGARRCQGIRFMPTASK